MSFKAKVPERLFVIRHGQSKANVARAEADNSGSHIIDIDVSDKDVPLTELGQRQALALGRWFRAMPEEERPDVVLVSPYLRAIQTADIALSAAGIDKSNVIYLIDERLREKSYGILDGLTKVGIKARYPEEAVRFKRDGKFYCQPPGGESWCDVALRLRSMRNDVRALYAGRRVAIFAHQVVVQVWRYIEEGLSDREIIEEDRRADVPNCGVVAYRRDTGKGGGKRARGSKGKGGGKRGSMDKSGDAGERMVLEHLYFTAPLEDVPNIQPHNDAAPVTAAVSAEAKTMSEKASPLYPALEPFLTGRLKVSDKHEIYFEEAGNPFGKPVVFVHGGPGGGISASYRQYFDPTKYRIFLFDQRGCGKSLPYADLEENTTWDLVEDMEKLRKHFGIEKWMVFGGSWGSTLSLAYAEAHPDRVSELVLRGIFLVRKKEIDWFYQHGASEIFPDAWEHYLNAIPEAERGDLLSAFHKRLTSDDREARVAAARAWSIWEGSTSKLFPDENLIGRFGDETFAEAFARIECHYFVNRGFMRSDSQLLDDVHKIRHIPTVIVQGRYDVVCPMTSAWDLKRAFPEAELVVVPDAGHSMHEPGIAKALVAATDRFAA